MEEIKTITAITPEDAVKLLTSQGKGTDTETIKKQWDVKGHKVFDEFKRPDKQIKDENGHIERLEYVARIGLALQKLIVKRAASFAFGNPVNITAETDGNKTQEQILEAVKRVLRDNKVHSFNRRVARELFSFTEVAEVWFPVEGETHETYGFEKNIKLRKAIFAPSKGDTLYPLFDDNGDMVAFSREYMAKGEDDKKVPHLDTYTPDWIIEYRKGENGWEIKQETKNPLGKIPVVYARQEVPDWQDVQDLIDRLEKLLSNFADTNDYHASPKIFVQGKITGFTKKGESGAILEGTEGSTASYLSWQHAPESVKLEIETLTRMIYTLTQTPDIAFDSVRGIGNVTGIALKMLFMDAHLKVADKMEIMEDYLLRRLNIIKAYMGVMNNAWKTEAEKLEIEVEVVPFMVDDMRSEVELLVTANGGKPVISQKTSIKLANLVNDHDAEAAQIKEENERENYFDVGQPSF